jgi:hypothetical protein
MLSCHSPDPIKKVKMTNRKKKYSHLVGFKPGMKVATFDMFSHGYDNRFHLKKGKSKVGPRFEPYVVQIYFYT